MAAFSKNRLVQANELVRKAYRLVLVASDRRPPRVVVPQVTMFPICAPYPYSVRPATKEFPEEKAAGMFPQIYLASSKLGEVSNFPRRDGKATRKLQRPIGVVLLQCAARTGALPATIVQLEHVLRVSYTRSGSCYSGFAPLPVLEICTLNR